MSWLQKLIEFLSSLFAPKPTPPPPAPGPAPEGSIKFPSGRIKSRGPNGRDLSHVSWQAISRWEPSFSRAAAAEGRGRFGPLLLACFGVIESEGNHYTTGQMTGSREQVIRGHGDPRSIGLLQIRTDLHDPQEKYKPFTPDGNIRLGAKLLADWMDQVGPWEEVVRLKWHPGTDPFSKTTQDEYIRTVRDLIAEVKASWTTTPTPSPGPSAKRYDVAGIGQPIPLPLPAGVLFRQQLTPMGPNRSGRQLKWTGVTQHTTNNQNGMGATAHANWQASGTPGNPGIGVHFYVDDREIVQTIPVNEQGVHSGDWRNQEHVAVELCVRAGGQTASPRAEANSIALMAGLLKHLGKTGTEAMHPHTKNATGHCPRLSVSWSEWERRVDAKIKEIA